MVTRATGTRSQGKDGEKEPKGALVSTTLRPQKVRRVFSFPGEHRLKPRRTDCYMAPGQAGDPKGLQFSSLAHKQLGDLKGLLYTGTLEGHWPNRPWLTTAHEHAEKLKDWQNPVVWTGRWLEGAREHHRARWWLKVLTFPAGKQPVARRQLCFPSCKSCKKTKRLSSI